MGHDQPARGSWEQGPLVGCVLRTQTSLGGELTLDLALGERLSSSAWPEDGKRVAEEGNMLLWG